MLTKKELAFRLSPDLSYKGAINRLMRLINGDAQLLAELRAAHYRPHQHYFTEQQVRILEKYLM